MKRIIMFFLAILACASLLHGGDAEIVGDLEARIENAARQYRFLGQPSFEAKERLYENMKEKKFLAMFELHHYIRETYERLYVFVNAPCFYDIDNKYTNKLKNNKNIDIDRITLEIYYHKKHLVEIGREIEYLEDHGYSPRNLDDAIKEIALYSHFLLEERINKISLQNFFNSFSLQDYYELNDANKYYPRIQVMIKNLPELYQAAEECFSSLVSRTKPFFDQEIALRNQEKRRQNDFRSHVKTVLHELKVPSDFYWDGEYAITVLESPFFSDGEICFILKLFVLPGQTASISAFHPYVNDEHLGSPKLAELYAFDNDNPERKIYKQGESVSGPNEVTYVFAYDLNDVSEACTARIIVSGKNVRFEKNIPIREMPSDRSSVESVLSLNMPMKMEGTRIIRGKKENNHLLIPTVIQRDGKKVNIPLLLDTGASITVIPLDAYSRISETNQNKLSKIPIQTANGSIEVPIDILVVNTEAYSKKMNVALSEDDVCLLGVDYFEGYIYTVDVENECLYLTKNR